MNIEASGRVHQVMLKIRGVSSYTNPVSLCMEQKSGCVVSPCDSHELLTIVLFSDAPLVANATYEKCTSLFASERSLNLIIVQSGRLVDLERPSKLLCSMIRSSDTAFRLDQREISFNVEEGVRCGGGLKTSI